MTNHSSTYASFGMKGVRFNPEAENTIKLASSDSIDRQLYYVAFGLYIAAFFLSITTFPALTLERFIKAVAIALLVMKLARQTYSWKSALVTFAVLVIGLASWRSTKDVKIITLGLFVMSSNDVDVKMLAKIVMVEYTLLILVTVLCAALGYISSNVGLRSNTGRYRSSMGFTHPNRFGSMLLVVVCANAIYKFPRFTISHLVYGTVAFMAIYVISDSKSAMLMTAVVTVLAFACGKAKLEGRGKRMAAYAAIAFAIIVLLSLYCTINYDSSVSWMSNLNAFTGYRFGWGHRYYVAYPATLMGRPVVNAALQVGGEDILMIDNTYARLLILHGVIPLTLYTLSHILRFGRSYRLGVFTAADFGLLICSIAGITEHNAMLIAMNFSMIALNPWNMSGYEELEGAEIDISASDHYEMDVKTL